MRKAHLYVLLKFLLQQQGSGEQPLRRLSLHWRKQKPRLITSSSFLTALISDSVSSDDSRSEWEVCSISQVEEAKVVLRLVPIWATCLLYAVAFAQSSTLFTKQGSIIEKSIGPNFKIPPAALQTFIRLSVVLFIPIYDRIFVPVTRVITGKPSGITMLQRIGCGMFLSVVSMVVAALIETRRLKIALNSGLIDIPTATVPMSIWWLVPQYILFGISDVFTMVGLQEFFYDQVPNGLKSLGSLVASSSRPLRRQLGEMGMVGFLIISTGHIWITSIGFLQVLVCLNWLLVFYKVIYLQ